ncbi:hypothetical protein AB0E00_34230 [Streptomyces sp. NPDC048110]|uniref:hypothetical protein n=1 Tax=Streptomyces sp. NPDC048110 TaxID=3155483 RepID=UPI0033F77208
MITAIPTDGASLTVAGGIGPAVFQAGLYFTFLSFCKASYLGLAKDNHTSACPPTAASGCVVDRRRSGPACPGVAQEVLQTAIISVPYSEELTKWSFIGTAIALGVIYVIFQRRR